MKTSNEIKIDLHNRKYQIIAGVTMAIVALMFYKLTTSTGVYKRLANIPTPTSHSQYIWTVRSIETMSQTKDRLCSQPTDKFINKWVEYAREANTTHITYSGFYDSPSCGDADAYAARWEKAARKAGLKIWWRQMFTEFEGIDKPVVPQCNAATKEKCNDYIALMVRHIKDNKDKYRDGDIFSITAEPAAGRIRGVTCHDSGMCAFESATGAATAIPEFNAWILDSIEAAQKTFKEIGVDVRVNAGGFDLFVAIGYGNPDWGCDNNRRSILYHETVEKMGGFVMDHYFDSDTDTMASAIKAINYCYPPDKYPDLKFQVGEWGPIYGDEMSYYINTTMDTLAEAGPRYTSTFNYWQGGPFGQESLFFYDGSNLQVLQNYGVLKKQFNRKKNVGK